MRTFSFPRLLTAAALLAFPFASTGQIAPQIAKVSATRSFSAFLLGSDAARKTQLLYQPAELPGAPAGPIHRVYFMHAGTGATVTLSNLRLTLGQTANTAFVPTTRFYAGQTTVLAKASYTIAPGTAGGWFGLDLDTTFAYDPARTLIVGVSFTASANQAFGTFGDNTFGGSPGVGRKLYAATDTATVGLAGSAAWQHFGFDNRLLGTAADPLAGPLLLFPIPAADHLTVVLPEATASATLTLTDALGRVLRHHDAPAAALRVGHVLDVRTLPAGAYALTVEQAGRRQTRRVIIR